MSAIDWSIRIADLRAALADLEAQMAARPDCEIIADGFAVYHRKLASALKARQALTA